MKIHPIASTLSDNFMYLAVDGDQGLLVDPIDADTAAKVVRELGLQKVTVLTTHGHYDHAGGNERIQELLGCEILAPAQETGFPIHADRRVSDGDILSIGATAWKILGAPGHTPGHIAAWTDGHLLSGDVVFVGGVGNCRFGGDAGTLFTTITARLSGLPDNTHFYPGHDYAARNIEFILSVEPDNQRAQREAERVAGHSRDDGPWLTTLGQERAYNPFLRVEEPALQERILGQHPGLHADIQSPAERTFRILRELRDSF